MKRFYSAIAALAILLTVNGCADITKSSNYETHNLKYIVNLTGEGATAEKVDELKTEISNRLNKFTVANVLITESNEEGQTYLQVEFGTIDEVGKIKSALTKQTTFSIKKKIVDESDFETDLLNTAKSTLQNILNGENFELIAQNDVLNDSERIFYSTADWMFKDEIKDAFAENLGTIDPNTVYPEVIEYTEVVMMGSNPLKIASILKLNDKKEVDKVIESPKLVDISHILIAYQGSMAANDETTKTKEEAKAFTEELKTRLDGGEDFTKVALENSDDKSNNASGGALAKPAGIGAFVDPFEKAALELTEVEQLSEVIESPFGFHIIKAREITEATTETLQEMQYKFAVVFYALKGQEWDETNILGDFIGSVNTKYDAEYDPFIELKLNNEGKDILKTLTEENLGEVLGIFVGNELITSFTVKETNEDGLIVIHRPNNSKEADELIESFNTNPLPLPIVLMGDSV